MVSLSPIASVFLSVVSIILSNPTPFLPPLLLPSSSSSVQADSFKISSLPLISSLVPPPSSSRQSSTPPSPSVPSGPCRYCNLCQCHQPSDEESDDLYRWVQQQFYSKNNNGEQSGEETEEQKGEGSGEKILRLNNEAHKERAKERTEEEEELVQSAKDGVERHANDKIANMEENELRRRRDRLL
eukprot:TRINITY_DN47522_c0_g1_i1.p1 TRINITY_DN47522_c0_g1~~TRINITY_DN47522_c0_g1_i1.p1  ORF type:complete len:185 (+),score=59.85 TRINITY_DN47522_c0_g1_i1:50-604(+)